MLIKRRPSALSAGEVFAVSESLDLDMVGMDSMETMPYVVAPGKDAAAETPLDKSEPEEVPLDKPEPEEVPLDEPEEVPEEPPRRRLRRDRTLPPVPVFPNNPDDPNPDDPTPKKGGEIDNDKDNREEKERTKVKVTPEEKLPVP